MSDGNNNRIIFNQFECALRNCSIQKQNKKNEDNFSNVQLTDLEMEESL